MGGYAPFGKAGSTPASLGRALLLLTGGFGPPQACDPGGSGVAALPPHTSCGPAGLTGCASIRGKTTSTTVVRDSQPDTEGQSLDFREVSTKMLVQRLSTFLLVHLGQVVALRP